MQLETVCRVSVGDLGLEVRGQVDNVNCTEGTFLRADTATDTQPFRDVGNFGFGGHLDAQFAGPHHGTGLLALLSTFLRVD